MAGVFRQAITLFIFWLTLFASFRPVFWLWQPGMQEVNLPDFAACFLHGLYMDASLAGYFTLLPLLISAFRRFIPSKFIKQLLQAYHLILTPFAALIYIADLEIFRLWGHHTDSALVPYLAFPREALASTLSAPWHLLFPLWLVFSASWIFIWTRIHNRMQQISIPGTAGSFTALLLAGACIIPIRGGLQLAPMNQSSVYFSDRRILNQAAENPIWVFGQSLMEDHRNELQSLYCRADPNKVKAFCDSLYYDRGKTEMFLNRKKPNVVLIIWESLSAKVAGCTGGNFPSTPQLDKLASDGLLFTRMYANGDRSDKGLVSILSGQPAFGKISLMSHPSLSAGFDFLSKRFEKLGYSSQYFYGGELEFANMKSFLIHAGYDKLTGKDDFPAESWNSKWGAHDEVVLNRQLQEAGIAKEPFFHTVFTLSSHEPFEVPGIQNQPNTPPDSLFCRAHRYTDRCLGDWVKMAEKQPWWNNTLVIVIADHGHAQPGNSGESDPEKFHIPMLWFGPALKSKGNILQMGNQTDLFATLCRQLGDTTGLPAFSKNLLSDGSKDFAFFAFRNGCALLEPSGIQTHFDEESKDNAACLFRQWAYRKIYP